MSKKQNASRNVDGATEQERERVRQAIAKGTFLEGYKSEMSLFPGLLVFRTLHRGEDGLIYWWAGLVAKGEASHTLAVAEGEVRRGYHFNETRCDCPGHRALAKLFKRRVGHLAKSWFMEAALHHESNELGATLPS